MCYGGCRNGAECAGGGGLKSATADHLLGDRRSAAARGSPVRGSPTSMPRMLVGDPEPTPQCQKLDLLCGRVPERSESGTRVGGKKQTSNRCAGVGYQPYAPVFPLVINDPRETLS